MHLLSLGVEPILECLLAAGALFFLHGEVGIDLSICGAKVRQNKCFRIVWGEELAAHIHEVSIVRFLINGVVELFLDLIKVTLLSVLIHGEFGLFNEATGVWLFHEAHQLTVARVAEFDFKEGAASTDFVLCLEALFDLLGEFVAERALAFDELLDEWSEAAVLLSVGYGGWAGDDQWCACLVNEDGVDLVNDGEVVATLDLLFLRG